MRKSTAKILSAAGVGLFASLALTAAPDHAAAQARECLAAPKGPAPAGSHWFYRTDRATKRNCWYVRATGDKAAAPTEAAADAASDRPNSAPAAPAARSETASADSAAPVAAPKPVRTTAVRLHSSIANARAEVPEPAPMRDAAATDSAAQFPAPLPTTTSTQQSASQPTDQAPVATQGSPIDQRWSDAATAAPAADPASAADASSKLRTAAQAAVAKGGTPATAALSSAGSASTLIAALLAALALAGLIVGGLVKFSRRQPAVRRDLNGRPDIWRDAPRPASDDYAAEPLDLTLDPSPPTQPTEVPAWIRAARQRQTEVKATDEIEELLARAQKRPAA
ncbi:MAG: hypothetical protein HZA66_21895 [Rhodopseudomonas palustris]|uniref:Uncharacterized protein n=1 Tax=Rhodopseudomonas palustris TaxID=1076 RepID=A0A933S1R2_RHOPL|nr:hypothetical protein [Rhodopseudomonas palustris]